MANRQGNHRKQGIEKSVVKTQSHPKRGGFLINQNIATAATVCGARTARRALRAIPRAFSTTAPRRRELRLSLLAHRQNVTCSATPPLPTKISFLREPFFRLYRPPDAPLCGDLVPHRSGLMRTQIDPIISMKNREQAFVYSLFLVEVAL